MPTIIRVAREDFSVYLAIFLFAFIARFLFLPSYPYISSWDELRDPGYNALKISQGAISDLFGFGSYQGYGNFIPLISYFLMFFMKTSILIYRIPAAFIGILSVLLTYMLTRIWMNKYIAFSAALFLAVSIKHIHYSRTELLIVMDSLLVLFILCAAYVTIKSWKGFFFLGLVIGLTFHFYAGTRSVAAITAFYLFVLYLGKIVRSMFYEKNLLLKYLKETILGLALLISGFFIALGPTINNLNINNAFSQVGTTRLIVYDPLFQKKSILEKASFVASSYKTAFLVYTFEPSDDPHLQYYQPMLNFPINLFFILGLLLFLFKSNKSSSFSYLLPTIIFLNPFLNQVLINSIKNDHRLVGVTPILSIIAAYGFITITNRVINSNRIRKITVIFIATAFYLYQIIFYFLQRPSDYRFNRADYMFYYIAQYIKNDESHSNYYILQDPVFDLTPLHFKEGFEFLDYPKTIEVVDRTTFFTLYQKKDPQIGFITTQDTLELNPHVKTSIIHNCRGKTLMPEYSCPLNFEGRYLFYILDNT